MAIDNVPCPTSTPTIHRKFQKTEFLNGTNTNKYWIIEWWEEGIQRVAFGRVGAAAAPRSKYATRNQVETLIADKKRNGYNEVTMHTVQLSSVGMTIACHAAVQAAVEDIMKTAGEAVAKFLNVKVENLSQSQIENARKLLGLAQSQFEKSGPVNKAALAGTVQAFYNTIPTKLPPKIKAEDVVQDFTQDFGKHSDRLDQLEAQLAQITPVSAQAGSVALSAFDTLAQTLTYVERNSPEWKAVSDQLMAGLVHGYKVRIKEMFAVTIPTERAVYESNTIGTDNKRLLWHGTRSANIVHILRGGLKIMNVVANGSMFGRGLYFACQASKSINYISSAQSGLKYVFLHEVALGKQHIAREGYGYQSAPQGYDSVWGKQGYTRTNFSTLKNHEYIVYNAPQQTMKYLVSFE